MKECVFRVKQATRSGDAGHPGIGAKRRGLGTVTGTGSSGSRRPVVTAPVAHGDAAAAQALGVPAERIVVLDTPTDTAQEAYALREFLGTVVRFVLVTSASHRPRLVQHFERVGLAPMASPARHRTGRDGLDRLRYRVPSAQALRKTARAVYEYLGLRALDLDHPRGL